MPRKQLKTLYLGVTLDDLNKKVEDVKALGLTTKNVRQCCTSAGKLYGAAGKAELDGDEERAYVLLMKFVEVVMAITSVAEYKNNKKYYDDLVGLSNLKLAIERCEKLSKSLTKRYDLKIAEEEARNILAKQEMREAEEIERAKFGKGNASTSVEKSAKKSQTANDSTGVPEGYITSMQLYKMCLDKVSEVIIMDARPATDFAESRIVHRYCISVPEEIVKPGVTVQQIQIDLPEESKEAWLMRSKSDFIVLLDWQSRQEDVKLGKPLQNLKDAIFKWDSITVLKSEPLILLRGYEDWLLRYPTLTTNSNVQPPKTLFKGSDNSLLSLDFSYPDLDEAFVASPSIGENGAAAKPPRKTDAPAAELTADSPRADQAATSLVEEGSPLKIASGGAVPAVNRSLKPRLDAPPTRDSPDAARSSRDSAKRRSDRARSGEGAEVGGQLQALADQIANLRLEKENSDRRWMKEQDHLERIRQDKNKTTMEEDNKNQQEELAQRKQQEQEAYDRAIREKQEEAEQLERDKAAQEEKQAQEEIKRLEIVKARMLAEERERALAKEKEAKELRARDEKEKHQAELLAAELTRKAEIAERTAKPKGLTLEDSQKATPMRSYELPPSYDVYVTSPGLPSGWEKVLDKQTGRYYYRDHNKHSTHWQLPQSVLDTPNDMTPVKPGSFRTRLKEEPGSPSSPKRMSRSSSSPNIRKLLEEEEEKENAVKIPQLSAVDKSVKPMPVVPDRSLKPSPISKPILIEISATRLRNMQPVYGSVGQGLTGLRNLGNSCYMNSSLQGLSNTTPLVKYFLNGSYKFDINRENKLGYGGEIAEEFTAVLSALWSGQYRYIAPRDFKYTVGRYGPLFAGNEHQDSQEFMAFLLDSLHEDVNKVRKRVVLPEQDNDGVTDVMAADKAWQIHKVINESIIVSLFQGQFKSTVACLTCEKTSVTFDPFMYLSLPLPSGSRCRLQDCLRLFFKEEKMTGDSRWSCPRCKTKRDAVKRLEIWRLPPILIVLLKRFYYEGMFRHKIQTFVDFPISGLNMADTIRGPKKRSPYWLYAVSNHYGSLDGGHYTAYCKNSFTDRWCKFDDSDVTKMDVSDIRTPAAYMLFYSSIPFSPPVASQL
ncbi:PREDICTED: ubiquitin carboxyl-terminal hydrolase 8-like [Priapulus caudatus]|uniref:ubiquitinyl hydrolase 1 n=1 Tax=Priapulus caudatus TaxID=37621 RepID=A0ABM1F896_PRICU|nr:PREDICTED: ubiquitin carboxyl-terminal hydrolase 8-like [Priapulus caudatus]